MRLVHMGVISTSFSCAETVLHHRPLILSRLLPSAGLARSRSNLSRRRPYNRVMCMPLILSTVAQCGVVVTFQLAALWMLQQQPGYVRARGGPELTDSVVSV